MELVSSASLLQIPLVAGLAYEEDFVSAEEEVALLAAIDAAGLAPFRFQGWLGKRVTASFGWCYDFDRGSFEPAAPIPDFLIEVRERAARFAGLEPAELVQALLIRYDPGAAIGWHRDRPVFDQVVGISLGDPAVLRLRRRRPDGRFTRAAQPLVPRSAYHLTGEVRHEWEHSIAPGETRRWSITFRSLSERGKRLADAA